MVTLTRPEGSKAGDLDLSRRGVALALAGGYAVAAFSAEAAPVKTDEAGLVTATVQLPAKDRQIPAYLPRPAGGGKHPVVVVVSEIFGVHEYIRDICRRLAKLGYVAIAPDFFVRAGDPSKIEDFPEIMRIVATASQPQVLGDVAAATSWLKGQAFADTSKMAITGFCWGGTIVWLACAENLGFDAGAAWYGRLTASGPAPANDPGRRQVVDIAKDLKAPVLGLYAEKDQGIPLTDVEAMRAALKAAGKTGSEIVVYPGAQHGFHADYRPSYNQAAAEDGWKRMLAHFAANGVAPRP